MRRQLIPEKYLQYRYIRLSLYALIVFYIFTFFGYRFSYQMLTGDLRPLIHYRAGFSLHIPPYWSTYKSGVSGWKDNDQQRLLLNQGPPWRTDYILRVSQKPSDNPSFHNALLWFDKEISTDVLNGFESFDEFEVNGNLAQKSIFKDRRYTKTIVVVLGKKNEYVLYTSTSKPEIYEDTFNDMMNSFIVLDGY